MKKILYLILSILLFPSVGLCAIAFPGAEGFGAVTRGAYEITNSPTIYRVTNLNASGAGSFQAAAEASGSRIIIFDVGGTINLGTDGVRIDDPYLTIAGQTAPGDGIAIRGGDSEATIVVGTHDVIIRGLRIRQGAIGVSSDGLGLNGNLGSGDVYDVIVDHCSITWGNDENASHYDDVYRITWSWNIIAEGLNGYESGYNMLLGSPGGVDLSVHHNLFASTRERMPVLDASTETELINNVMYNCENRFVQNRDGATVDIVGNYFKSGPMYASSWKPIWCEGSACSVYLLGNIGPDRPTDTGDEWDITNDSTCNESTHKSTISVVRSVTNAVTITSPTDAYADVLASDGAGAIVPARDAVDLRIVGNVTDGDGPADVFDDPDDVGGYPTLASGSAWTDTDSDGMPDSWETTKFGDLDQDETTDYDSDGYYDLEEWINSFYESEEEPTIIKKIMNYFRRLRG